MKYVKENYFNGRDFKNLYKAKQFWLSWLNATVNRRIHGTIGKGPETVYPETEKQQLWKHGDCCTTGQKINFRATGGQKKRQKDISDIDQKLSPCMQKR